MTPKSLWTIVIKMFGIWFILNSFWVILDFVRSFGVFMQAFSVEEVIIDSAVLILTLAFYLLVLRYCIYMPDKIIKILKLDQGFDEEKFELNIHRSTVLSIGIIVIGGVLFVDALPNFCEQIFTYFESKTYYSRLANPATKYIILQFVKILIGYLLMTNSRFVVNLIERSRKK